MVKSIDSLLSTRENRGFARSVVSFTNADSVNPVPNSIPTIRKCKHKCTSRTLPRWGRMIALSSVRQWSLLKVGEDLETSCGRVTKTPMVSSGSVPSSPRGREMKWQSFLRYSVPPVTMPGSVLNPRRRCRKLGSWPRSKRLSLRGRYTQSVPFHR